MSQESNSSMLVALIICIVFMWGLTIAFIVVNTEKMNLKRECERLKNICRQGHLDYKYVTEPE